MGLNRADGLSGVDVPDVNLAGAVGRNQMAPAGMPGDACVLCCLSWSKRPKYAVLVDVPHDQVSRRAADHNPRAVSAPVEPERPLVPTVQHADGLSSPCIVQFNGTECGKRSGKLPAVLAPGNRIDKHF